MTTQGMDDHERRGATVEAVKIRQALFRLFTILQASETYPTIHAFPSVATAIAKEHAEGEFIEALLMIVVSLRIHHERHGRKLFRTKGIFGYLKSDVTDNDDWGQLSFKDACDKVIHASDLRFGGGTEPWEIKVFERSLPGPFVLKTVQLEGRQRNKRWRAVIDLWPFCEEAAELTRLL